MDTNARHVPADNLEPLAALIKAGQFIGAQGWVRATGGNFSVRVDSAHCMITRSGRDKSQLCEQDFMICTMHNQAIDASLLPSAETPIHTTLYQLDSQIGAILHCHSVVSTVLSRATQGDLILQGYEMQKSLVGNNTHAEQVIIPIFDNDQDMDALADQVQKRYSKESNPQPGFLVRGHGLYAWGKDVQSALRHVEGLEFLFACAWQEKLLQGK